MKTTYQVIGAVCALGATILCILHLSMLFGLTRIMRTVVLPRIKAESGIDVRVGRLSINLASGLVDLKRVEIRNPDGFLLENLASADRVEAEIDLWSLFGRKALQIRRVVVDGALVNVIRNPAGEVNVVRLIQGPSEPEVPPSGTPPQRLPDAPRQPRPTSPPSAEPSPEEPLRELAIDRLQGRARIRYLDLAYTKLDVVLDLDVAGRGLSTQSDPQVPWGGVAIRGSLGSDRTRFVTDLRIALAPVADLQSLSFDLTGRVLEIDPRLLDEVYDRMGIRSAPFGLEPVFHCRNNVLTNSVVALDVRDIQLEEKLSRRLGGMGAIGSMRVAVPVGGTLDAPEVDVGAALVSALGGNARSLLDAFLGGAKDLAGGQASATNAPLSNGTDALVDLLGDHVREIGEDEALKADLKRLGRKLFGE